jgi:methionyl aminopeptidase
MIVTNPHVFNLYQEAGRLSTEILRQLKAAIKPGILPIEVDQLAEKLCAQYGVKPAFKGVNPADPYQYSTCISVNDVVVHGIPSRTARIKVADVVKVDFGIIYQGLYTDHCFTVAVGKFTPLSKRLVAAAKEAVVSAIPLAVSGNTVGDLGQMMQSVARREGFDVLKQYTGHGIGRKLHDPPAIPAFGAAGTGVKLEKNMILCLEAQVVAGSDQVVIADDGWSVKTKDGCLSAMFEYMVAVGEREPMVLTETRAWGMIV